MKKIILGIFILLGIYSCSDTEYENTVISFENDIIVTKEISIVEQEEKIQWSENIKFTFCDGIGNYENEKLFQETEQVQFLFEKLQGLSKLKNLTNIGEYCVNSKKDKYIAWGYNDYRGASIVPFRYDKNIDIFEASELRSLIFYTLTIPGYIPDRNYGSNALGKYLKEYTQDKKQLMGFGKRKGNIISFVNYGVGVNGVQESGGAGPVSSLSRIIKNKKSTNYCQSGMTSKGNLAICFIDIYYSYDFINNIIKEDKICSYYIDDDGTIKILESCYNTGDQYRDIKWPTQETKKYEDDRRRFSTRGVWVK